MNQYRADLKYYNENYTEQKSQSKLRRRNSKSLENSHDMSERNFLPKI